jgi:predicted DNA-binding protein (MmcQ/YjbR family)
MGIDWIREHCLSLPHTTEHVVWEDHLVFKVGGKMYAITSFEPAENWLAFKCTDDDFATLVEQPGVIPSPYLARAKWVSLQSESALRPPEVKRLLCQSYDLVLAKLPRKTRDALSRVPAGVARRRKDFSAPGTRNAGWRLHSG